MGYCEHPVFRSSALILLTAGLITNTAIALPLEEFRVNVTAVNLRRDPSAVDDTNIIRLINEGTTVFLLPGRTHTDYDQKWIKVVTKEGYIGWICKSEGSDDYLKPITYPNAVIRSRAVADINEEIADLAGRIEYSQNEIDKYVSWVGLGTGASEAALYYSNLCYEARTEYVKRVKRRGEIIEKEKEKAAEAERSKQIRIKGLRKSRETDYGEALTAFNNEHYELAINKLNTIIESIDLTAGAQNPTDSDIYLLSGKSYIALKNTSEAKVWLRKAAAKGSFEAETILRKIADEEHAAKIALFAKEETRVSSEILELEKKKDKCRAPAVLNVLIPGYKANWKPGKKVLLIGCYYGLIALAISEWPAPRYVPYWDPNNQQELYKKTTSNYTVSVSSTLIAGAICGFGIYSSNKGIEENVAKYDKEIAKKKEYLDSIRP